MKYEFYNNNHYTQFEKPGLDAETELPNSNNENEGQPDDIDKFVTNCIPKLKIEQEDGDPDVNDEAARKFIQQTKQQKNAAKKQDKMALKEI